MLVHESVYDQVVDRVLAYTKTIKLGRPFDEGTTMGPVISSGAAKRIVGVIDRAKSEKAGQLLTGGAREGGDLAEGFFVQPTVFGKVDHSSHLAQEEVFGPVMSITTFADDADALLKANNTNYGLGAYLHTRDFDRAHRFAGQLESGVVYLNSGFANMTPTAPFGGMKQSGFGSEGGKAGLDEFLRPKSIFVAMRP
jgi:aldehyde dehydrogenase (NAD+)